MSWVVSLGGFYIVMDKDHIYNRRITPRAKGNGSHSEVSLYGIFGV